jgi:hypothetical protein
MISGRKISKNFKIKSSKKSKKSEKSKKSKSVNRLLPQIDSNIHLSDFGYSLDKTDKTRKTSLKRASKKEGTLLVLRRLNLIRNYTSIKSNKSKMTKDVDFLKKEYKKEKKEKIKKSKK